MALYTKAELSKQSVADLRKLAEQHGFEYDELPTKVEVTKQLLELTDDDALADTDDEELEDDTEVEDDEEDDEVADDEEEADDELDEEELDDELPAEEEVDEVVETKKPRAAKAKVSKGEDGEATLAAKQVATLLGTEAKTLRQFFRSPVSTIEAVGSGGRYEFLETDVPQIKSEFETWKSAHAARGSKRGKGKASTPANIEEIEEVEEIEELEIEELDDEVDDEELELDD